MHMNVFEVIKGPILTEKTERLRSDQKKVVVDVATWANKYQVADAIKQLFKVEVSSVNLLNCRGKVKRLRTSLGKQKNYKKAYLTFSKGSDVDLFGVIGQETVSE